MKIKMKEAGESPEFGAYQAGDEIDETRAAIDTMRRLVERNVAEGMEQRAESKQKPQRAERKEHEA